MVLSKQNVFVDIQTKLSVLDSHLSMRVRLLLDEITKADFGDSEDVELFDLLVRLVFIADREPASIIANLMVPLSNEGASLLEDWTLSNSGAFLKDYLKKESILELLAVSHERNGWR